MTDFPPPAARSAVDDRPLRPVGGSSARSERALCAGDLTDDRDVRAAVVSLGQRVTDRLFSAGLDLSATLAALQGVPAQRGAPRRGTARERLVQDYVERAVDNVDDAIKDLRALVIAISRPDEALDLRPQRRHPLPRPSSLNRGP